MLNECNIKCLLQGQSLTKPKQKAKSLLEVDSLRWDAEMALPRQNSKIVKSFNQKRKNKFVDDDNFHVIMAPGEIKWWCGKDFSRFIWSLFCSFFYSAVFWSASVRRAVFEGFKESPVQMVVDKDDSFLNVVGKRVRVHDTGNSPA